ncbi:MAG: tetratricopeptide repeat protein [Tepidisphaeraceae bacterium]
MAESSIDKLLESAKEHHKAGRRADAEPLYRRYLSMKPDSAEAAHLLGYLTFETGNPEVGLELIRRAIVLQPDKPEFHCNLGVVFANLHRYQEAVDAQHNALSLKPAFPEAWYNLAGALYAWKKVPESLEAYQRAIALRPDYADAYNNYATVLSSEGRIEEAVAAYQQALILRPDFTLAAYNLGNTLRKLGRIDEAIDCLRKCLALEPEHRDACRYLAIFLRERGQWDESVAMFRRALYLFSGDLDIQFALAEALCGAGNYEESITLFRKTLAQSPGSPAVYRSLGYALQAAEKLNQAEDAFNHALKIRPDYIEARSDLGNLMLLMGRVERAIIDFDRAIQIRPTDPRAYTNRLAALHYLPEAEPAAIYHEHVDWNQKHAQPLGYEIRPHENDHDPDRRLRIGYVSPDFREHSVSFFVETLLANHDPNQVEVFAYADSLQTDAVTARLQKLVPQWRNITGLSDQNVAEMIRTDRIDILVDLAGHTAGNRLLVFARKPAPIQITYLGYPDTTGLSTMDYRLTDLHADPPGMTEPYYIERLLRLPRSFLCYRPPSDAPEVSPLPAQSKGFITFGSFNTVPKMNAAIVELWCRILKQVPQGRMLIKNAGLSDESVKRELLERFTAAGIDPWRVDLRSRVSSRWKGSDMPVGWE